MKKVWWSPLVLALLFSATAYAEAYEFAGDVKELKAYYEEGLTFMKQGQAEKAIESFQTVLRLNPKMSAVHNLIGVAYLQIKDKVRAEEAFLMTIKHEPKNSEAYFNLGNIYMGPAGNTEIAAEYYEKTVEYDPQNARAFFGLGWIEMLNRENPGKALEYFTKVTELAPNFAEGYYGLGMAYLRTGRRAEALHPISKLRELGEDEKALRIEAIMKGAAESYQQSYPTETPVEQPITPTLAPEQATDFQIGTDFETTY